MYSLDSCEMVLWPSRRAARPATCTEVLGHWLSGKSGDFPILGRTYCPSPGLVGRNSPQRVLWDGFPAGSELAPLLVGHGRLFSSLNSVPRTLQVVVILKRSLVSKQGNKIAMFVHFPAYLGMRPICQRRQVSKHHHAR